MQELVLIAVVALLAVGPKRMPTLMRAIGKTMRELRKATRDLGSQVGLDQIMGEDTLRDPLGLQAPLKSRRALVGKPGTVREMEQPEEGLDLAEARAREDEP